MGLTLEPYLGNFTFREVVELFFLDWSQDANSLAWLSCSVPSSRRFKARNRPYKTPRTSKDPLGALRSKKIQFRTFPQKLDRQPQQQQQKKKESLTSLNSANVSWMRYAFDKTRLPLKDQKRWLRILVEKWERKRNRKRKRKQHIKRKRHIKRKMNRNRKKKETRDI